MLSPPSMFDGSSSSSKFMNRKRFHFFKIIHPATIQQKRLGLPKKFIRKFGKELSEVAVLTVPNGKKWHVELKEIEGQTCLENGWQEFVDYYSIGAGHFLVFGYDGSSCIHVLIFDTSATEIEYPCHIMDFEEPNQENECQAPSKENKSVESLYVSPPGPIRRAESVKGVSNESVRHQISTMGHLKPNGKCDAPSMEGSDPVEILDVSPKRQKRTDLMKAVIDESEPQQTSKVRRQTPKRDWNSTKNSETCFTGTRSTESDGSGKSKQEAVGMSGRAIHAARQFKSENPFCVVNVRSSYVNGPWMYLPFRFMETYAKRIDYITLVSNNGSGKEWRCHLLWYNSTRLVMIYDGWKVFVAKTNLKDGDVCIFELINVEHNVFNVSIYRD